MKLCFINHYAGLPDTVPATRTFDLAVELRNLGHSVEVMACSVNHYTFREERLSCAQLWKREFHHGVSFVWLRGIEYQGNGVLRLLNMLLFSVLTVIYGLLHHQGFHLYVGTSVHPFAPLAALILARVKSATYWKDITDIWPESLIELGHISATGVAARCIRALEHFTISSASRVIGVIPGIADYVRDCGVAPPVHKSMWISNGIQRQRIESSRNEGYGVHLRPFRVMYAGGFAPGHALDILVDAIIRIHNDSIRDIEFVLIGDGPERKRIVDRLDQAGVTNCTLPGLQPKDKLYQLLSSAHVCVCTGRKLPVYRYGVSYNKIYDYLLAGRPTIFAMSASNNPIAEFGAGVSIPAEDSALLARTICEVMNMPQEQLQEMGLRARQLALSEFDYQKIAHKLSRILAEEFPESNKTAGVL